MIKLFLGALFAVGVTIGGTYTVLWELGAIPQ